MVITALGVFTIGNQHDGGMTLIELASDASLDQIKSKAAASFKVADTPRH